MLFPFPLTAIEPRAAGQAVAGEPPPPSPVLVAGEKKERGNFPITPWPFSYLPKSPPTF